MTDLPSEQTLAGLSWYAQAAYATRCARRAQPLYVTTDHNARKGLESVLAAAEAFVKGTGDGYTASRIFSTTSFPDLPIEMMPAVYASFGAGQVCSIAGNNLSIDDATIPSKAKGAATVGLRAYQNTTFAPGPIVRASAIASYIAAAVADADKLASLSAGSAGVLGSPISLTDLGPLWPDGAPDWLPRADPDPTPATPNGMVRFDDPQLGPVFINPTLVALVRQVSPSVTEVVLNLDGGTQTIVLHIPIEQVQTKLASRG